ncbi:channel protein hemolysin III family [Clostridium sp. CAG:793]|nr:channel protein hemolysin III family [Clostridium sp. CAG:793]
MHRTKLKDRELPTYTKGEEIFNMVSHIVGGAIGLIGMVLCIIFSAIHQNSYAIVGSIIYGISMIFLYTMSSIYHGLKPTRKAKKVMQILDHCTIYVLIAGTYTPILLSSIMKVDQVAAWTMLAIVWIFAILGIVLNAIDLKQFRVFSMICYIAMGWCIIFRIDLVIKSLGMTGFILILLGGIIYTLGTILYGIGKKVKYMHSMFHLCVVIGTLLQLIAIILYVV